MPTVVITGASRGLGLALAAHYQQLGWRVIATARDPDSAHELQRLAPSMLLALDVQDEASIARAVTQLGASTPVDLLINNAGVSSKGDLASTTKAALLRDFEVNAVGAFLVTRALLPHLRLAAAAATAATHTTGTSSTSSAAPPCAMVAQISSQRGSIAQCAGGGGFAYKASKAALNMLSYSLALDAATHDDRGGVAVLMVHPGYVKTDMTRGRGHLEPADAAARIAALLASKTLADSGAFVDAEADGATLPW